MTKKSLSLFFFCVYIFVGACKKYPDGPLINLEPKRWRLMDDWTVYYYSVDGNDSTNLFTSPNLGEIHMSSPKEREDFFYQRRTSGSYFSFEGSWAFSGDKKRLIVNVSGPDHTEALMPPYAIDSLYLGYSVSHDYICREVEWEIRRLKEHDLWLQTTYRGRTFVMKLKS